MIALNLELVNSTHFRWCKHFDTNTFTCLC